MITPGGYQTALQIALVSLASYICGEAVTGYFHSASAKTGGMWAVMSAVVVLQQFRGESVPRVWRLIVATLIGSLVGAAYLSTLGFSAFGLAVSVFLAVIACHALRLPPEANHAALSVGVVMVVTSLHPGLHPLHSAALRFAEACIGTAVSVLAVRVWRGPGAG